MNKDAPIQFKQVIFSIYCTKSGKKKKEVINAIKKGIKNLEFQEARIDIENFITLEKRS